MTRLSIFTVVALFFIPAIIHAKEEQQVSGQDVWLIDTHGVSWVNGNETSFQSIAYYRFCGKQWRRSNAETFFQSQNPRIPLFIFSPGYTATTESVIEVGMEILGMCDPSKSIRMVFWNWPAQREVIGLRRDIRAKIPVAAANARYLSRFLGKLRPESKVCMLGFSFGARLLGDAVELLGEKRPEGMRLNLIFAGAAMDHHWIGSSGRNRNVPRVANKILILYNPQDFRLRFYPFMYDMGVRPQSLGRYGPPMSRIDSAYWHKIDAVNIRPFVGIRHSTLIHLQTPVFRKRIDRYLFFEQDGVCNPC